MNNDSHANGEIVRGPASELNWVERPGDDLRGTVTGKYRIVIDLDNAHVDALTGANVQASAHLHRKASYSILDREIELWKEIERLLLPILSILCRVMHDCLFKLILQ